MVAMNEGGPLIFSKLSRLFDRRWRGRERGDDPKHQKANSGLVRAGPAAWASHSPALSSPYNVVEQGLVRW